MSRCVQSQKCTLCEEVVLLGQRCTCPNFSPRFESKVKIKEKEIKPTYEDTLSEVRHLLKFISH